MYSQRDLLEKMRLYCRLMHEQTSPHTPESDAAFDRIDKKMGEGCCVGFSFSYGYMRYLDELPWWEALIEAIAEWDETPASLKKVIKLKHAKDPMYRSVTLDTIFKLVVDYVYGIQGQQKDLIELELPKGIHDGQLTSRIELRSLSGDYISIEDSIKFPFNCADAKTFSNFFNRKDVKRAFADRNRMMFLCGRQHLTYMYYEDDAWFIYDPNDWRGEPCRVGSNLESLRGIIKSIASSSCAFEMVMLPPGKLKQKGRLPQASDATGFLKAWLTQLPPKKVRDFVVFRNEADYAAAEHAQIKFSQMPLDLIELFIEKIGTDMEAAPSEDFLYFCNEALFRVLSRDDVTPQLRARMLALVMPDIALRCCLRMAVQPIETAKTYYKEIISMGFLPNKPFENDFEYRLMRRRKLIREKFKSFINGFPLLPGESRCQVYLTDYLIYMDKPELLELFFPLCKLPLLERMRDCATQLNKENMLASIEARIAAFTPSSPRLKRVDAEQYTTPGSPILYRLKPLVDRDTAEQIAKKRRHQP